MGRSGGEGPARERCNGESPAHAAVRSESCPSSSLVAGRTEATQKSTTGMPARHPWLEAQSRLPTAPTALQVCLVVRRLAHSGKPSRKTDALALSASARVSRGGNPMARIARSGQVRDFHHGGALDRPTSALDRDDLGGKSDRGIARPRARKRRLMPPQALGDGPLCRGALFARRQ